MSESKHTPGPWEVNGTRALGAYGVWTAYGTHPGAIPGELYPDMICSMRPQDTLGTQERRDANARLIAAAPSMLNVLQAVSKELRTRGTHDWFPIDVRIAVDDVIAKAEGTAP